MTPENYWLIRGGSLELFPNNYYYNTLSNKTITRIKDKVVKVSFTYPLETYEEWLLRKMFSDMVKRNYTDITDLG